MFTISTHDNNIKHADPVIIFYYVYQNWFFCSFHWFGLAIIISISKMLVKKSTDLKLNLPLSRRLRFCDAVFRVVSGNLFLLLLLSFLFLSSLSSSSSSDSVRTRFLSDERLT